MEELMKRMQRILFMLPVIMLSTPLLFSQTGEKAAEHIQRKAPTIWDFLFQPRFFVKVLVMLGLGLAVFALLKTKKMNKGLKVALLVFATFLFGLVGNVFTYFAMHPSAMCAATKGFLYGFRIPFIITLGVIFLLTFIGPRLFCGWVCPVGALQELIAMLSDKLKIKRGGFSFTAAHGVRLLIFLLFIFLSVTAVLNTVYEGETYALSIYDYLNPFHGMEFSAEANFLEYAIHYLPLLLTIILAIKYYRPFCHFVCPIGLFTHWMEQTGLFRIRFNKKACTDCGICENKSPCAAIPEILKDANLRPDCYACNECIAQCPENALDIGVKRSK
jgi:polyferredoxin